MRLAPLDGDAELGGPLPGQWGDEVTGTDDDPAGGHCGLDLAPADDAHSTSSGTRAATAASRAVSTSDSLPERNTRPKRPTARISTTSMLAAFLASLAARPA